MSKPKSKPTSPRGPIISSPALPEHFAEQVLDFETELDLDCNISSVTKLMELYSSAIEFYESRSDPKYLHYQDRLNNLLSRKDVITLLNFGSNAAVSKLKPNEMLKKMQEQVANRQKLRSHQVGLFMNNCLTEIRDADQIMKKHRSDNHLAQEKLIENIRNQESPDLASRAEARRRRSGTPTGSFNRTFSINSITRMSQMEKYQEEVEKVLEICVEERNEKIKEIKKKYKEEIKQIKGMGNDNIITQVIGEMKTNMKVEISELEKEIREKKRIMIEEVKNKNL